MDIIDSRPRLHHSALLMDELKIESEPITYWEIIENNRFWIIDAFIQI